MKNVLVKRAYIAKAKRDRSPSNRSGQSYSVMSEEADVYVVGAGPEDNARLLDELGPLEAAGLRRAAEEAGRGGRGVAVVVPPGNGGALGDSCAFDGMVREGDTRGWIALKDAATNIILPNPCCPIIRHTIG